MWILMELDPLNYFALDVSVDWDTEKDERVFVFNFTPRKDRFDHHHIEVSNKKARELRDWLNSLLEEPEK